jgi:hypothetical protein
MDINNKVNEELSSYDAELAGINKVTGLTKIYNGSNPNSLAAWIYSDVSGSENDGVEISDEFGSFNWHRKKAMLISILDLENGICWL